MAGLGDILFGSGGELETRQVGTLTPEQDALLRTLIGQLGGVGRTPTGMAPRGGKMTRAQLIEQAAGGGGSTLPTGTMDIAGGNFLDEAEQTSLAGLEERAMMRATGGLEAESNAALQELIKGRGSPGDFEDFFATNVRDPMLEDFRENISPAISRSFGGSSFFGSERAQADRAASEDLIQSLTQSRSKLAMDERTQSADRMLRAIGLAPEVDRVNTETLIKELSALGTGRQARNERINQLMNLLGVKGVENLGGMTSGTTGLVQAFLGGGGGEALGGLIGSDRRLKKNIRRVGVTPGGIPLYSFNYIGERGNIIGVMADEVEDIIPDAVVTIRGIKYVDYSKVA